MNDRQHSRAWLVESMELDYFLDLAYTNHFGEIWLYNNDLRIILDKRTFNKLYKERIAKKHRKRIDAVKILLGPDAERLLETKDKLLIDHLEQIASLPGGKERLSTFYVGSMEKAEGVSDLKESLSGDESWVFYTHEGQLEANSGVVMLRRRQFPFDGKDQIFTMIWLLKDQQVIQKRLKRSFEHCFLNQNNFRWINVTNRSPFDFELKAGESDETIRRKKNRNRQYDFTSLGYGDSADVAVIAALPEEMMAFENLLDEPPRPAPSSSTYRYTILRGKTGPQKVLLATLPEQGNLAAAVTTWDIIQKWSPKHIILIGVAGGEPKNMEQDLGDLVIGRKVIDYELAKVVRGVYKHTPRTYQSDDVLFSAATKVIGRNWQNQITAPRPDKKTIPPKVHYDLSVASGNKLVEDPMYFMTIKQKIDRKIRAMEMEGAGVAYACDASRSSKMLLIKGIMDKSDSKSRASIIRDKWKDYAAAVSAQFVVELIQEL